MKSCLKTIKATFKTVPFTRQVEMCAAGCTPLTDAMMHCPECNAERNKKKPTFLKMISVQDKMAQLLACDETRALIEEYKTEFKADGVYRDVFSGEIFSHVKVTDRYNNKHDILLGLCVDAFSSKAGRQSMVMVYAINFSLDPSIR
jgi:hypothetical protein